MIVHNMITNGRGGGLINIMSYIFFFSDSETKCGCYWSE